MRKIVHGNTTTQLDKNVSVQEGRGWKRITANKLDDSGDDIRWVCVMEKADKESKNRNSPFNSNY
jgi:hypothetical protein